MSYDPKYLNTIGRILQNEPILSKEDFLVDLKPWLPNIFTEDNIEVCWNAYLNGYGMGSFWRGAMWPYKVIQWEDDVKLKELLEGKAMNELQDHETNVLPFKRPSPISMPDSIITTGNWLLDLPDGTVFLSQAMNDARNYNLSIRQKVQAIDTAAVLLVHPEQTMEWVDPARFVNQWRFIRKVAIIENTDKREPPVVKEQETNKEAT